jgi:uncharacterized protein YceH (UPF0502 family)
MAREPALIAVLPRQPGTKEARYAHLLSGEIDASAFESASTHAYSYSHASSSHSIPREADPELQERMAQLEAEVAILTRELGELRQDFDRLSKLLE